MNRYINSCYPTGNETSAKAKREDLLSLKLFHQSLQLLFFFSSDAFVRVFTFFFFCWSKVKSSDPYFPLGQVIILDDLRPTVALKNKTSLWSDPFAEEEAAQVRDEVAEGTIPRLVSSAGALCDLHRSRPFISYVNRWPIPSNYMACARLAYILHQIRHLLMDWHIN